ncbi:MAG: MFS transporter, partial [Pseudomonadota bacterium]
VPWLKESFFGPAGPAADGSALASFLDWCQHSLGFKPENALIGGLSMAFMVVYMVGAPVFGWLAERYSRWSLIGIGVILWSLASGGSGLATGFGLLLLTRCFVGIGEAAYGPVAPTIISDFYPVKMRGQVLAWFYMAIPVGSALGYVLGEGIAKSGIGSWGAGAFGFSPESWRWAFYCVMPPGILLGSWCFFMREPPSGQADLSSTQKPARVQWRDYLILLRTPSYVYCTLGMAAMTFAIGGIAFWMPFYLTQRTGTGDAPIGSFGKIENRAEQVREICRWVDANLTYAPGATDSRTSAWDVWQLRKGVCRDYTHLAIALCRALSIPARYVGGYAAGLEPMDFHACLEVYLGGQWYLLDPSDGIAPENIVIIARGRDAANAPLTTIFGKVIAGPVKVTCLQELMSQAV